jgi:hypothetical protein
MNRRFPPTIEGLPERPLTTVKDVRELLGETINHLRSGRLDPRVANTVGYLATAMLKALQDRIMQERRLARVESELTSEQKLLAWLEQES